MRAADNASVAALWIADAAPFFGYRNGTGPVFDLVYVLTKPMRQSSASMASCIASRLMTAH